MYVELNNRKYHLNEPFNHKVSALRKNSTLKIEIGIYVQEDEVDNMYSTFADIIDNNLLFFENLKSLPDFLYFHNTYYFWIFEISFVSPLVLFIGYFNIMNNKERTIYV